MSWAAAMGGVASYFGGERANKANKDMARDQMLFQQQMSNTQYQRAADDMQAAGLNRILALGGPSSSPQGATAQMQNTIAPAVSTALESSRTVEENALKRAKTALTKTDKLLKKALLPSAESKAILSKHAYDLLKAADDLVRENNPSHKSILKSIPGRLAQLVRRGSTGDKNFIQKIKAEVFKQNDKVTANSIWEFFKKSFSTGQTLIYSRPQKGKK